MSYSLHPDLIFDIGMNEGMDTAYYLHRGYRVVAVEANPMLCQAACERFSQAITAGRLHVENVAVGAKRGQIVFYVSSLNLVSSLDEDRAAMDGSSYTAIDATCVRAADLFEKHGVPHYLKIDIEGADSHVLADLNGACLPDYVSFEDGPDTEQQVRRLAALGYKRFKLINQSGLTFRSDFEPESAFDRIYRRLFRKYRNVRRGHWYNDWDFHCQDSGPFGEEADGRWVGLEKLLEIRSRWRDLHERHAPDRPFWYDVHASRRRAGDFGGPR
jgi:FkbM family methyltransferase